MVVPFRRLPPLRVKMQANEYTRSLCELTKTMNFGSLQMISESRPLGLFTGFYRLILEYLCYTWLLRPQLK